jgi:type IV secretion system protein VirD4
MRKNNSSIFLILLAGAVFLSWFAVLIAPAFEFKGAKFFDALSRSIEQPFAFKFTDKTLITVFFLLLAYVLIAGMIFSSQKNRRKGEEYGSAKWGDPKTISRKYQNKKFENNKILTENVRIGSLPGDIRLHRRNLNTLIIGGSGAGKTRSYGIPNLMQCNDSMVVLDPKGEILRTAGRLLKEKGYALKVLNLIDIESSDHYNPLRYLRNDSDCQVLCANLFKATTPKGATSSDPFWDTSANMLLMSFILYCMYELPPENQNFTAIMELLLNAEIDEDNNNYQSPVDLIMDDIAQKDPNHIILKYWRAYRSGSGRTLKSIQITLASKLEKFNLESIAEMTRFDELELDAMGEKKTALFALIPDNNTSFNFLVSILYTQLFQQLFYSADYKHGGSLPIPVHFLMDEFANVSLPDDFEKILSVMRSRGVYVSIIIQNMAQLKALFEKQWESIAGNCDTFLYLGGNEQSTHKYVSELLGKETIVRPLGCMLKPAFSKR